MGDLLLYRGKMSLNANLLLSGYHITTIRHLVLRIKRVTFQWDSKPSGVKYGGYLHEFIDVQIDVPTILDCMWCGIRTIHIVNHR